MKKILIADDSQTARMFIRKCLEISGFRNAEFIEAENGRQALNVLKIADVDMVFSNLAMPVTDGEALLESIKNNPELSHIPVFMITSAGDPAKEKELLGMGAEAVIKKPISPPKLLQATKAFKNGKSG